MGCSILGGWDSIQKKIGRSPTDNGHEEACGSTARVDFDANFGELRILCQLFSC